MRSACRVILGLCLFLCAGATLAQKSHSSSHLSHSSGSGSTHVHGYTRNDGTYVSPHYRGAPGTASSSARTIDVSGAGRSDLSEWAATHRMNSAAATTTERLPVSSSAASASSIAWSHPSTVRRSGTSGGAATANLATRRQRAARRVTTQRLTARLASEIPTVGWRGAKGRRKISCVRPDTRTVDPATSWIT